MKSLKNDEQSEIASSRPMKNTNIKKTFQDAAKKPLEDDDSVLDVSVTPRYENGEMISKFTSGQNTVRESFIGGNNGPPAAPNALIF